MISRRKRSSNDQDRRRFMQKGTPSLAKLTVMKMNESARRFLSFRVPSKQSTALKDKQHEIQFHPSSQAVTPLSEAKQTLGVSVESVVDDMFLEEGSNSSHHDDQRDIVLTPEPSSRKPKVSFSPRPPPTCAQSNDNYDDDVTSGPSSTEFSQDCTNNTNNNSIKRIPISPRKRVTSPKRTTDLRQPSLKDFLASTPPKKNQSMETKSLHGDASKRQGFAALKSSPRKEFSSLSDIISEYESIVGDDCDK